MSKSKPKTQIRSDFRDEDNWEHDRKGDLDRRRAKKMKNIIRSKNVAALLEMEEEREYSE